MGSLLDDFCSVFGCEIGGFSRSFSLFVPSYSVKPRTATLAICTPRKHNANNKIVPLKPCKQGESMVLERA